MGIRCADHVTPLYPQKLALIKPTGGGRSVGIVRSRTKAKEFFSVCVFMYVCNMCMHVCTYLRVCIHIHVHACKYVYMSSCMPVYTHVCTQVYTMVVHMNISMV